MDELTTNITFKVDNGINVTRTNNDTFDMTGNHTSYQILDISTSYEAIAIGDIATAGFAFFKNVDTDTDSYIEIGVEVAATFYPFVKLNPGEAALLRLGTSTIFAQTTSTNTSIASQMLESFIVED